MLTKLPKSPYRNLLIATLIGCFSCSVVNWISLGALHASSLSEAASLVGDAFSTSLIIYLAATLILIGTPPIP